MRLRDLHRLLVYLCLLAMTGCPSCDDDDDPPIPFSTVPIEALGVGMQPVGTFCCEEGKTGEQRVGELRFFDASKSSDAEPRTGATFIRFRTPPNVEVRPLPGATVAQIDGSAPGFTAYLLPAGADATANFEVIVTECPASFPFPSKVIAYVYPDKDGDAQFDTAEGEELREEGHVLTEGVDLCTVAPTTPPPDSGSLPDNAVFSAVVSGAEGIVRSLERDVAGESGTLSFLAWVAGADGFAEQSLLDGSADSSDNFAGSGQGQKFGALPVRYADGETIEEGVFHYGPSNSAFTPWFDGAWGGFWQTVFFQRNLTDAWYLTGQEFGHQLIVCHGGLSHFFFDPGQSTWRSEDIISSFSTVPGSIVTGAARSFNGDRIAVIDGQPGAAYLHTGTDSDPATKIGDVGDDPRRIRCAGNLAVVSNFGGDSLTLIRWLEGVSAAILETIAVGDGPVGIDVRVVEAGIAIVSTGFNDNTYTITVVDPTTLAVISKETRDAPDGVTGVGHGVWLSDTHIAITGNTSNTFAVLNVAELLDGSDD